MERVWPRCTSGSFSCSEEDGVELVTLEGEEIVDVYGGTCARDASSLGATGAGDLGATAGEVNARVGEEKADAATSAAEPQPKKRRGKKGELAGLVDTYGNLSTADVAQRFEATLLPRRRTSFSPAEPISKKRKVGAKRQAKTRGRGL